MLPTLLHDPPSQPGPPSGVLPAAADVARGRPGDLWPRALTRLRELSGRAAVDAWLTTVTVGDLQPLAAGGFAAQLLVPDSQVAEFVAAHYLDAVQAALTEELGAAVVVELAVAVQTAGNGAQPNAAPPHLLPNHWPSAHPPLRREEAPLAATATPGTALAHQPSLFALQSVAAPAVPDWQDLAPRFNFERFVVGSANELAHAAARAVAEEPAAHYNPLFLHGGVGLGKTHLLHAIGQLARARRPGLRVRYVAAETYIDDTYSAWRSRDASVRGDVRAHYRDNVDLLLVDDVQFLQTNDKIGEEFFHLFNALHQAGRQIVLSCDRFPSELQSLHERLRSRFEWGLVAELLPPDRELRIAILRRNALELGLALPHDVVLYLADHLRNNVRELEGALNKLSAHARIGRRSIDMAMARSVLGPIIEMPTRNLTAEVIQRVTCQHFGIKITDLKGQKRHRTVVVPRMIAMSLVRKHTGASFPEIGRMFGGRDHSTVMHACHKIAFEIASDHAVQSAVQAIETALGK